ncbi:hypothetical protein M404DRAFT_998278 [Pisolithus tinctorius Marx 270]|uniref:Uncharacterized protein n=1 Tax=Pisolithus tinctorius Marx 270 TaxID=870435 RepID=A0A0C3P1D4_PISTI|nr:hypothetical protein M404DRAFT_998278 [Pisolithus tinctorius Marx 270]
MHDTRCRLFTKGATTLNRFKNGTIQYVCFCSAKMAIYLSQRMGSRWMWRPQSWPPTSEGV